MNFEAPAVVFDFLSAVFLFLFFFWAFLQMIHDYFLWECPCCFPRGPNVSYSTNVCVTGCQGFSRSVAPVPARNAVGWKAVRGAIVARVCPPVRLSADLSSHCHLTGQTRGGGKKGKKTANSAKSWGSDERNAAVGFCEVKANRAKSLSLCEG